LSGGCIIAWKRGYSLQNSWASHHTCTAILKQQRTCECFTITNVYGPTEEGEKERFIQELTTVSSHVEGPWILAGDFNLVRWLIDRSEDMRGWGLMSQFNDFIRCHGLTDVPLNNRAYTWSNKQPTPIFSKLDRVFVSDHFTIHFLVLQLQDKEMIVSDHVPLLLQCKGRQMEPRIPRFELSWLNYEEATSIVNHVWSQEETTNTHSTASRFQMRVQTMHEQLANWHRKKFGKSNTQLQCCKEAIIFFDRIEERRPLSPQEFRLRVMIKEKAYELACFTELRWKQRSRSFTSRKGTKHIIQRRQS
jgi:Endonuclease-reverse transcriptase